MGRSHHVGRTAGHRPRLARVGDQRDGHPPARCAPRGGVRDGDARARTAPARSRSGATALVARRGVSQRRPVPCRRRLRNAAPRRRPRDGRRRRWAGDRRATGRPCRHRSRRQAPDHAPARARDDDRARRGPRGCRRGRHRRRPPHLAALALCAHRSRYRGPAGGARADGTGDRSAGARSRDQHGHGRNRDLDHRARLDWWHRAGRLVGTP